MKRFTPCNCTGETWFFDWLGLEIVSLFKEIVSTNDDDDGDEVKGGVTTW